MRCPSLLALAMGLFATTAVNAQSFSGTVRDVATSVPVAGVEVTLEQVSSGARVSTLTSESGTFTLRVSDAADYYLDARRIGYQPFSRQRVRVPISGVTGFAIRLRAVTVQLDTVRTQKAAPGVTSGKEMVRRHLLLGKGLIVSGFDIERSGLLLSEYLTKLDGVKLVQASIPSLPAIPAQRGFLMMSRPNGGVGCLYGRINQFSVLLTMLERGRESIDDLLKVREIMAVEIYRTLEEIPTEWRTEMLVQDIFVRLNGPFYYPIGHSGRMIMRDERGDDDRFITRIAFTDRPSRFYGADTTTIARFKVIPQCAFMQIWTRLAWD